MAFKIGDPIDAASYNAVNQEKITYPASFSMDGEFLSFEDEYTEGVAFYSQYSYVNTTYNLRWFADVTGDWEKHSLLILENEVQVFRWAWGESAPSQNDRGYPFQWTGVNTLRSVFLPPSTINQYRWRARLNDEIGQTDKVTHTINVYQAQNNMVAGERIRAWNDTYSGLLAEGTTELTHTFGLTGRLGSEK